MHFLLGSCLLTSSFFFLVAHTRASRAVRNGRLLPPVASHGPRQPGPVSEPARFGRLWSFAAVSSIARPSSLYADADPLSSRIRDGAATPKQRAPKGIDHTWSSRPFKSRGIRNCARPTVLGREVWRPNYRWSFCAFRLASLNESWMFYLNRDAIFTVYLRHFIITYSCQLSKITIDLTLIL